MNWWSKRKQRRPTVRPLATFRVDFAEKVSGDEVGGRNVARALKDIVRAMGWTAQEPSEEGDHGWVVDATLFGRTVACQVQDFGEETLLTCINERIPPAPFRDFLLSLNSQLQRDARFRDVVWRTDDEWGLNKPGSSSPVDEAD